MILSNLKELVGNSTDIKLKLVDDIPRTKAGKFRWVKNEFHTA